MITTDKRFWVNGIEKRGGYFYTVALSIKKLGLMLCFARYDNILKSDIEIVFYKLI